MTPPLRTICLEALMSKALAIKNQVGLGDHLQANRGNFLTLGHGVSMMMPEQMQARLHGGQDLVNGGLPGIDPAWRTRSALLFQRKGAGRLVREEHIDPAQAPARLNFFVHEMSSPVV